MGAPGKKGDMFEISTEPGTWNYGEMSDLIAECITYFIEEKTQIQVEVVAHRPIIRQGIIK